MCYRVKGYTDRHRVAVLCFAGNILNRSINQIISGQLIEIAHTATYQTLKNEYIPLNGKLRMSGKIGAINLVTLVNRNVVRRPVYTLLYGIIPKRVIGCLAYVIRPNEKRAQFGEYAVDRILPSWLRFPTFRNGLVDFGVLVAEGVFIAKELLDVP